MQLEPSGYATIKPVLGDLQLSALRLAWRNQTAPPADRLDHDVFIWQILEDVYGWEPADQPASRTARFNISEIGETEYRKRYASVSRTLALLENRRYVKRAVGEGAADLTRHGVQLCRRLFE